MPGTVSHLTKARRAWAGALLAACLCSCAAQSASLAQQRVEVDARPNGIAVRPSDGAVFITDDRSNSILYSSDDRTFARYAALPVVAGQPNSLGEITFADSRTLLAARFGFGSAGALFEVAAPDSVALLNGPNPARRRLGLFALAPGQLLSSWFVKHGSDAVQGGVSLITYDATTHAAAERDLLVGLGKPVGIVVAGDELFVSDQASNTIVKASLSALLKAAQPAEPSDVFARIDGPDLLTIDGNGTLYTKCHATGLCRIARDGTVTVVADDLHGVRGVAVDTARNRLYVIERASEAQGANDVRWFPLH
jgi:DNA-binding beta-propeller fold protein YncE